MRVKEQSAFDALVEKYYKELQELQENREISESARDKAIVRVQNKYQDKFAFYGSAILCDADGDTSSDEGLIDSDPVPLTSELREFIWRHKDRLRQINVIKESTIKRSCVVCGEVIHGLGLTDVLDAGISVCWDCCDENAYFDHGVALIDYI